MWCGMLYGGIIQRIQCYENVNDKVRNSPKPVKPKIRTGSNFKNYDVISISVAVLFRENHFQEQIW